MNRTKAAVIYIPGLGDKNPQWQSLAIKTWHLYGYKSQLVQMSWHDNVPFSIKLQKITMVIDEFSAQGLKIVLIGASAGASAAINAYAARNQDISAVITIAGKINHPETIGPKYHQQNPSFIESINQAQVSLRQLTNDEINKILCIYSDKDGLVLGRDSLIKGAKVHRTRVPYHPLVIAYFLTLGFHKIHKHVQQLTKGV